MPRPSRRSAAAKLRWAKQQEKKSVKQVDVGVVLASPQPPPREGTGFRPTPKYNHEDEKTKRYRLVMPTKSPGKKVVLFAGDSHLCSIVDNRVRFPEGRLSFGFSCSPGAIAAELKKRLLADRETVTKEHHPEPDLLCLLAPSNLPSETTPISKCVGAFVDLLISVTDSWRKVCVVDFPPRLSFDDDFQRALQREYHRAAADAKVTYHVIADQFPVTDTKLWARDGTHLSDEHGLPILMDQVWAACYTKLECPPPSPPKLPFPTYARPRRRPTAPVPVSPPAPARQGTRKQRSVPCGKVSEESSPETAQKPSPVIALQVTEFGIPLSPAVFSPAMAAEMKKISPSSGEEPDVMVEKTSSIKRRKAQKTKRNVKHQKVGERQASTRRASFGSPPSFELRLDDLQTDPVLPSPSGENLSGIFLDELPESTSPRSPQDHQSSSDSGIKFCV
ncbi:uncharacterized protein LOC129408146 [Boleophthalmus pectinirostris]|uniref:uncharacterized protein LOC129408146 n=1 Tax=Boleophthalmus pectinirostris TaxID=150288 RepID=UPI0024319FD3|nr:uncharacterized protein LOC129408146 [Boleophthalmus pectinirostris]